MSIFVVSRHFENFYFIIFVSREPESGGGEVRVYPGRVAGAGETFVTVSCCGDDAVADLMAAALERFGLDPAQAVQDFRCSEILLDRGGESPGHTYFFT